MSFPTTGRGAHRRGGSLAGVRAPGKVPAPRLGSFRNAFAFLIAALCLGLGAAPATAQQAAPPAPKSADYDGPAPAAGSRAQ